MDKDTTRPVTFDYHYHGFDVHIEAEIFCEKEVEEWDVTLNDLTLLHVCIGNDMLLGLVVPDERDGLGAPTYYLLDPVNVTLPSKLTSMVHPDRYPDLHKPRFSPALLPGQGRVLALPATQMQCAMSVPLNCIKPYIDYMLAQRKDASLNDFQRLADELFKPAD